MWPQGMELIGGAIKAFTDGCLGSNVFWLILCFGFYWRGKRDIFKQSKINKTLLYKVHYLQKLTLFYNVDFKYFVINLHVYVW